VSVTAPAVLPTTPPKRLPALRRLPVPDCQPPYDDAPPGEPTAGSPCGAAPQGVQGTLALSFVLPGGLPAVPAAPPGLRLVPPRPPEVEEEGEDDFGPRPTSSSALPDPRSWSGRFVQAVVEVLCGDRPLPQLVRWTSTEVYDDLGALVISPRGQATPPPARATVRSVHVTSPFDGVAEVAATVRRGPRVTAVALRLEGLDGRWQCTALHLG